MKTLKFGLIGAVALGLAAWSGSVQADVTIATAGPMTGQYAIFGQQMKAGAEKVVADLNAKGGVLGQKIKLVIGDDACDPKQAVAVANSMVNKGVAFMAGHFCSGSSIPASDVYNEEGILQISPASTNPTLTDRGFENVYRVCGRDDQQGTIAGNFLADTFQGKKIAVVHDKQAYSKGLADATKMQLNKRGINESLYDTVNAGEKDYSAFVTKLKQQKIDVLYYGGYHTEAGLIVRQMREQGMKTHLISGDALVTKEYWAITGASGEGTLMTFGPDPRKSAAAKAVVDAMRKGGYEPEGYTLYTYAAIQVWAQAAEKAGSMDLDKITKALNSGSFQTVLGPITFNDKGDIKQPAYVWYEWSKGKYAEK
ncbi:MAG: branched-chain amino acid ABC transporter substrate-binding protein [Alphaproteobacteria bacterium]|jgi:branched-chain amino acid transport system substrate-binding protein|nr:branched-chain amino acid ABC transporter substrate-binding protein [Alphaproteobacteria bacterium]